MAVLTVRQDGQGNYTTIQAACTAAQDNDMVEIQDSATYAEGVSFTNAGGWLKPITIRAASGQAPIMDGAGQSKPAIKATGTRQGGGTDHVIVDGLRFTNWTYDPGAGGGIVYVPSWPVEVMDCFFDGGTATNVNYAMGQAGLPTKILRCKSVGGKQLLFMPGGTDYVYVESCLVTGSAGTGIRTLGSGSHVWNCTVYVTSPDLSLKGISSYEVKNCISVKGSGGNAATGIEAQTGGTASYSCSFGWSTLFSGTQGAGNLTVDPLFVDAGAGDFQLQQGSPCRDTGATIAGLSDDLLGTSRPQGSAYDMGAYEWVNPAATVVSATAIFGTTLRIFFSKFVASGPELTSPTSWSIAMTAPQNGVVPTISQVTTFGVMVDLTTGKQTVGQGYQVSVVGVPGLQNGSAAFVGAGEKPTVVKVAMVARRTIRVTFSAPMQLTAALVNPTKYTIISLGGGSTLVVKTVTAEPVAAPTYVDLGFVGGAPGKQYKVVVATDV